MNTLISKVIDILVQLVSAILLTKAQEVKQLAETEEADFIKKQIELVVDDALKQIPDSSNFLKSTIKYFVLLQAESIEKLCEHTVSQLAVELNKSNNESAS